MNKLRIICLFIALLWVAAVGNAVEEDVNKPENYGQTVIEKAITFMPSELRTKLTAVKQEIIKNLKPTTSTTQNLLELCYFVEKEEGTGPEILADKFRIVRKDVNKNSSYSTMAPDLGQLAACVIALCQPYHTEETAFKGTKHAEFEKGLDTSCASLTATFDEFQKLDNPSEFGTKIAKRANEQLKKLSATENPDTASVKSAVFALASNSVADCWYTLLEPPGTGPTSDGGTGSYIGNKRSLKFHLPTCKYLPAEKNRVYYKTREEAVADGYVPCKRCKP